MDDITGVFKEWVDARNTRDISRYLSFYSNDCVCSGPLSLAPIRGKRAIQESVLALLRAFPDALLKGSPPVVCGSEVAFEWLFTGTQTGPLYLGPLDWTVPATGRQIQTRGISFVKFDPHGLIVEKRDYCGLGSFQMLDLNLPVELEVEQLPLLRAALHRTRSFFTPVVLGTLVVDFAARTASRGSNTVRMTHRELEVLQYLADRPRRIVSRRELLEAVWGYHGHASSRVVDSTIARLRRKIEETPDTPKYLHTAHGEGYYLVPDADTLHP